MPLHMKNNPLKKYPLNSYMKNLMVMYVQSRPYCVILEMKHSAKIINWYFVMK